MSHAQGSVPECAHRSASHRARLSFLPAFSRHFTEAEILILAQLGRRSEPTTTMDLNNRMCLLARSVHRGLVSSQTLSFHSQNQGLAGHITSSRPLAQDLRTTGRGWPRSTPRSQETTRPRRDSPAPTESSFWKMAVTIPIEKPDQLAMVAVAVVFGAISTGAVALRGLVAVRIARRRLDASDICILVAWILTMGLVVTCISGMSEVLADSCAQACEELTPTNRGGSGRVWMALRRNCRKIWQTPHRSIPPGRCEDSSECSY